MPSKSSNPGNKIEAPLEASNQIPVNTNNNNSQYSFNPVISSTASNSTVPNNATAASSSTAKYFRNILTKVHGSNTSSQSNSTASPTGKSLKINYANLSNIRKFTI
jgi:hypothetical protein